MPLSQRRKDINKQLNSYKMRHFKCDRIFKGRNVLKTPFGDDVARLYIRRDKRIVLQFGGDFRSYPVPSNTPLCEVLFMASQILDNWETAIKENNEIM